MSSLAQIRDLVSKFLDGSIESKEFADRFEPLLEAVEDSADIDASNLAKQIELRIARFIDGYISEVSLRVQLHALVPPPSLTPIIFIQAELIPSAAAAECRLPFSPSGAFSPKFGPETPANPKLSLINA